MPLVKNIHNRNHFHCSAVTIFRIDVILNSDKSYTERREHIVDILTDFYVVSSETG